MFIDFRERKGEREREKEGEREREREKHLSEKCRLVASHTIPDWESNPQLNVCALTGNWTLNLFGVWDDAPTNWATQPGHEHLLSVYYVPGPHTWVLYTYDII